MNARQILEALARLPARVWLQAGFGAIVFAVLAVLGFAVIAGVVALALVLLLGFKAKAWIEGLVSNRPTAVPPDRPQAKVTDVSYEIVEPNDRERR